MKGATRRESTSSSSRMLLFGEIGKPVVVDYDALQPCKGNKQGTAKMGFFCLRDPSARQGPSRRIEEAGGWGIVYWMLFVSPQKDCIAFTAFPSLWTTCGRENAESFQAPRVFPQGLFLMEWMWPGDVAWGCGSLQLPPRIYFR